MCCNPLRFGYEIALKCLRSQQIDGQGTSVMQPFPIADAEIISLPIDVLCRYRSLVYS